MEALHWAVTQTTSPLRRTRSMIQPAPGGSSRRSPTRHLPSDPPSIARPGSSVQYVAADERNYPGLRESAGGVEGAGAGPTVFRYGTCEPEGLFRRPPASLSAEPGREPG